MFDPSKSPPPTGGCNGSFGEPDDWDSIMAEGSGFGEGRKKAKKWNKFRSIEDELESADAPKNYSGMSDDYLRLEKLQTLNSNTSRITGIQTFKQLQMFALHF